MGTEPITHEYLLRCSPEHAFDAYAVRIGDWWPAMYSADASTFSGVSIEPHVGGAVLEEHRDGETHRWGEVTAWERGRLLSYTSTLAQTRESPSVIMVRFSPAGAGCRMIFEHGGWNERNQDDRRKFGDWPLILARFVELAEPPADKSASEGSG
jgi:hypothetical protein